MVKTHGFYLMSSHNGGGGGGAPTGGGEQPGLKSGHGRSGRVLERIKPLSYSASVNKLLLDVEADTTEGSVKTGTVGEIEIVNTGKHPAFAILAYRL